MVRDGDVHDMSTLVREDASVAPIIVPADAPT
jgi:hypothetical protein